METLNETLSAAELAGIEKKTLDAIPQRIPITVNLYNINPPANESPTISGTTPDDRYPIPVFYEEQSGANFPYAVIAPSGPVSVAANDTIEFTLYDVSNDNQVIMASCFISTFLTNGKKPIADNKFFTEDQFVIINSDLSLGEYLESYDLYFEFIGSQGFTQFCKIDPMLTSQGRN
ncbi:MAG: hypothetical protein AAGA66_09290 [Bacteroidota bacterium]